MLPAIPKREGRHGAQVGLMLVAFALCVFSLLYWNYPFDGMVVEESWTYYTALDASPDGAGKSEGVSSWLTTRRGGYQALQALMVSIGSTPAVVNSFCIAMQLVNLALFAIIVSELAGLARLYPILLVAILYPFASSIHFWQIQLVHHVAVLFFLTSLVLFLKGTRRHQSGWSRLLLYGLPSLVCFWLSLVTMEHAILMPLLFLYLALYRSNGEQVLVRFRVFWSPPVGLALCFFLLSLVFIGQSLHGGHPRLNFLSPVNVERFATLASTTYLPVAFVTGLILGLNAILFFSAAIVANSIGYLGYPFLTLVDRLATLISEGGGWMAGSGLVALVGAWGLYRLRSVYTGSEAEERGASRFLVTVGMLWAVLAYLPLASSFAYPRIIGQTADRINALALFGVSLCLGIGLSRLIAIVAGRSPMWASVTWTGCLVAIALLLVHLHVQREYWVEAYQKEKKIVVEVLTTLPRDRANGRAPLILLAREGSPQSVRTRLNQALQDPSVLGRLFGVTKVVLERHFTKAGEIEVTSFHLEGVPLFGGAPQYIFNGYARRLAVPEVPVYKIDYGTTLKESDDGIAIRYEGEPDILCSKRDCQPITLTLGESFFRFRGEATYRMQVGVNSHNALALRQRHRLAMLSAGGRHGME